jgi:hypothetical protein
MGQGGAAFGITLLALAYGGRGTPEAFALAFAVGGGLSALSIATAFGIGVDVLSVDRPGDGLPGVEAETA